MKQSELVRALREELAAKEKELADQKWLLEQFLKSPAWRWTAPVRWVANRLRSLQNGHTAAIAIAAPTEPKAKDLDSPETEVFPELKASFTALRRASLEGFLASDGTLILPHSAAPAISIVLILFNRAELTLACLQSIAENRGEEIEVEVIVVDNASSDKTSQLLDRLRGARVIRNKENRHFLAGVNQAARVCHGEHILLLNNDAQLLPGALQSALRTIRTSPDIGAVGGKIILLDWSLQEAGSIVWRDGSCTGYGRGDNPFAPMYSYRRDVDYCSGAFLLTPRKTWEQLGGFDETFSPAYYEETDYCMRLWQRGLRVVYEPGAAIVHYEFGSSESTAAAIGLQSSHQRVFAERHRELLKTHERRAVGRLLNARSRNAERRILFIDDRVPHLWLGSGFPRAHSLLRALRSEGYFVTIYPLSEVHESWDLAYSDLPREIEMMMGMGREMLQAFLRLRKGYYSAIIVSRPHNMKILAPILKAYPDWFEHVEVIYDAEALFATREIGFRKLVGNPMTQEEVRAELAAEIQLAGMADRVIAVSENERKAFRSHGIDRVEVLGHSIEPTPCGTPFESREGLLFVGPLHDEMSPNVDSLIWFLTEIFPKIRVRLGDVPLTIAGVNRSARIRELAVPPIRITGHLPALTDLYARAKVFVAPTRYGAGIPHKVHEAAAHGLPVVATPLLAEQLGWTDTQLGIAEDAETFATRCIEVYTNAARWLSLREAALERVRQECSPKVFEENVHGILTDQWQTAELPSGPAS